MPPVPLPGVDIVNIFEPRTIALGFLAVVSISIIIGVILLYHWHTYGIEAKRAWFAEILYFSGLAILTAIGLLLISLLKVL